MKTSNKYPQAHEKQTCFACKERFFYATGSHMDKCQLKEASESTVYCKGCHEKLATGELTTFEVFTGRKGHTF